MRCSATAIDRGEPIWQTRSTEPMSMPSSSDAVATTARSSPRLQPLLRVEPQRARQAAVMREHGVFAQPLGQMMRDALGEPARVDEHQRGPMLGRSARRGDRRSPPTSRCSRRRPVRPSALRPRGPSCGGGRVDDRDVGVAVGREELRDLFDRPHGRRQADSLRARAAGLFDEIVEPCQRQRQMRTRACRRPPRGSRRR